MAYPSSRSIAIGLFAAGWLGVQIAFFLPAGKRAEKIGNSWLFRNGRSAALIGAAEDRRGKAVRFELIPAMKKRGISRIEKLVINGHKSHETAALPYLQDSFRITNLYYPLGKAADMRRTFGLIRQNGMNLHRLNEDQLRSYRRLTAPE